MNAKDALSLAPRPPAPLRMPARKRTVAASMPNRSPVLDAVDRLLGGAKRRHLGAVMIALACIEAVLVANFLVMLFPENFPYRFSVMAFLTALIVGAPMMLFTLDALHRLERARRAARAQAVLLDDSNRELTGAKAALLVRADDLDRARIVAEQANAAKSHFLADMSHELRTPLNAVLGFSEMNARQEALFGGFDPDRTTQYARAVHESGTQLLSLVNDLLDLARIEAGHADLTPEPVAVGPLVADVARSLMPTASKRRQTIETRMADAPETVHADPRAIRQILGNLASNALKYSDEGQRIVLSATGDGAGGTVFAVTDEGIGMTRDEIAIVLDPFIRLSKSHIARGESCGLGLSIVDALVTLHGATLTLESEKGVGTTARVRFVPGA